MHFITFRNRTIALIIAKSHVGLAKRFYRGSLVRALCARTSVANRRSRDIISGFDKGKCAAPAVAPMTSFGRCTAQTKGGQSFHKTGIVGDGTELAFSMSLFLSHFCCAVKGDNNDCILNLKY